MLASYQLCVQTANAPLITCTLEGIFTKVHRDEMQGDQNASILCLTQICTICMCK